MSIKVALIFPGQGAQKVGMGREFYETSPEAKAVLDEANALCGGNLLKVMFEGPEEELIKTAFCQPAILAMSVAAYRSWVVHPSFAKVEPVLAAGLSLGEYSALAVSQTLTLTDTLHLVKQRGAFMDEAAQAVKGGMAAIIGFDKDKLLSICQQTGVEVANFNSHEQIVITGDALKVHAACEAIKAAGGTKVIPLSVAGAFHSRLMKPAAMRFAACLKDLAITPTSIKVVSNVDGLPQHDASTIRENLTQQITASVQWVKSMEYMMDQGITHFVEIGPGKVLKGLMRRINAEVSVYNIEKPADLDLLKF